MQYLLYDRNLSAVVMRNLEMANVVDSVSHRHRVFVLFG